MSDIQRKPGQRDISLDILKGVLTFFVITTHMVSFFPFMPFIYPVARAINIYVVYTCLMTFSCFVLILGYMSYKAYISKELSKAVVGRKLGKNFLKTMATYYVSAIAFTFFIKQSLNTETLVDILLFRHVVEYSEFILSFAFIYVAVFLFDGLLKKMNGIGCTVIAILALACTFIPYERVTEPLLGVITGTTLFSSFPLLQYAGYFVIGIWFAKNGIKYNLWLMLASAAGTVGFVAWRIIFNDYPSRFPPSLLWVWGGALFVYCALLLVRRIPVNRLTKLLAVMGQDSLYYMLFSNVMLFFLRWLMNRSGFNPTGLLLIGFYLVAFALCVAAARAYTQLKKRLFPPKT